MENWKNLNRILSLERKDSERIDKLSKEMIDFCTKGEKHEVKKILKEGAPLNCYDEHLSPLIACIQNDHYDLAYYLLRAGATTSYRPTTNFEDAFWYALKNKKHNFLQLFIAQRCLLQRDPEKKQTPLVYATINSDLPAVEALLSHYAINVNERDGHGNTALHYNVAKENMTQDDIEIGRLLIAAGADTAIANLDGKVPEDLAQDFSARSMLMAGQLEKDLPQKEEPLPEITPEEQPENGASLTKNRKMKI